MNFESLVGHINQVQDVLQAQAAHAVNLSLTARNWLVGYYIVEYEQHGEDRAKYGDKLLKSLAQRLNRRGLGERRLYEYRLTYRVYPQLGGVVAEYVIKNGQDVFLRLTTAKSEDSMVLIEKLRSSTAISVAPQETWQTPAKSLFYKLSATANFEQTMMYWHIGERINRDVLGNQRAEYGKQIVAQVARQLQEDYGKKGFDEKAFDEYMTELPSREVLQHQIQKSLAVAKARLANYVEDDV